MREVPGKIERALESGALLCILALHLGKRQHLWESPQFYHVCGSLHSSWECGCVGGADGKEEERKSTFFFF